MIKIYNSAGNKVQKFVPIEEGKVSMYVCGVTVYNTVHVGHARSSVTFDIIRRYLEYRGYEVKFVQNFTDIDDKIINRSNEENRDWRELSGFYIDECHRLMGKLGIKPATLYPKASEHITHMQKMIAGLVEKGHAYVTSIGDVYFDVATFDEYGILINRARFEADSVRRVTGNDQKRNESDFALWKAAKPGEPSWDSPWGKGRPGWHIECSAMSLEYLGETFDIHGGGHDLVFPHHSNEIAQSQCYTGKPMANYWMHNGLVQVGGEKMSKSLANFVSLEEAIHRYGAASLRMSFIQKHYRSPINVDVEQLAEASSALERLIDAIGDAEIMLKLIKGKEEPLGKSGKKLSDALNKLEDDFNRGMDDDFNTPAGLAVVFGFAQQLFGYIRSVSAKNAQGVSYSLLDNSLTALKKLLNVLGFCVSQKKADTVDLITALKEQGFEEFASNLTGTDVDILDKALELRFSLRSNKEFDKADIVRDIIQQSTNLKVKDWHFGSTASLVDIEVYSS